MSEINSIANGTYVIGQTSATNFVGGSGIKVDSPSEGTVRISNDETVLWSGDAYNGTLNLSEAVTHFEYIRIDFSTTINSTSSIWSYNSVAKLYPTEHLMVNKIITINDMIPDGSSLNTLVIRVSNWNINNDGNQFIFRDGYQIYFNGSSWSTGDSKSNIYKIIGINRISGSNA